MSLEWIDAGSLGLIERLARASVQGGAMALIVWAVTRGFPRWPARVQAWLWRLVFVKMLLTLVWLQPIDLALRPAPTLAAPPGPTSSASPATPTISNSGEPAAVPARESLPIAPTPAAGGPAAAATLSAADSFIGPTVAGASPQGPKWTDYWTDHWPKLVGVAWLTGVGIAFARLAVRLARARRLTHAARPCTDERLLQLLVPLARAFGLASLPKLCRTETTTRPLLAGIFRPALIFPAATLETASPESLRMMMAHELAHVRRLDLAWAALAAVVEAFLFFHPLVWLARRELAIAHESACDQWAMRATSSPAQRYAEMLLEVAVAPAGPASGPGGLSALGVLGVVENHKTLERRIQSMKIMTQKSTAVMRFAAAAMLLAAFVALVPFRITAADPEPKPPAQSAPANEEELELGGQIEESLPNALPKALAQRLRQLEMAKLRQVLPTLVQDKLLNQHLADLARSERDYAAQGSSHGEDHPVMTQARSVLKTIDAQIDARIDGILLGLEMREMERAAREPQPQLAPATAEATRAVETIKREFRVYAPMGGTVRSVFVNSGDTVKKGTRLLEMDSSDAEGRLRRAEVHAQIADADFAIARAEYDEVLRQHEMKQRMIESGAASPDALPNLQIAKANHQKSRAQMELAEIERDLAKKEVARCTLFSAHDGVVNLTVYEGFWVQAPGTMVGRIMSTVSKPPATGSAQPAPSTARQ